jgi:hypothetical protein
MRDNEVTVDALDTWCVEWLGSGVAATLFTTDHLSHVVGVRLEDGREIVVKVRAAEQRLVGCTDAQRALWKAGFPCPEPLVGPVPLLGYAANAEVLVPGGDVLPIDGDAVERYADLLATFIRLAPELPAHALAPNPPWVSWDHGQVGIWPVPDDRDDDLNAHPETAWIDEIGARVQRRLHDMLPVRAVIGHGDWEGQNLRWLGREPWIVHDWDSVVRAPEAIIVGLAAAVWPCGAEPRAATVDESAAFIDAYQQVTGRRWSADEVEAGWAAGLWVDAFNTKKASLDGMPWLTEAEAAERLRLAAA